MSHHGPGACSGATGIVYPCQKLLMTAASGVRSKALLRFGGHFLGLMS